jgi:polyhydroxyalkanoate synthesis regulator protein
MRRILKRYPKNRRLYDTLECRYISSLRVLHFIDEGQDIQILSATTDADITKETLLRMLPQVSHYYTLQDIIRMVKRRRKRPCNE